MRGFGRNARRTTGVIAASVAVVVCAFQVSAFRSAAPSRGLPYYTESTLTPSWPDAAGNRAATHRVGDFRLVDASGRTVTRRDVDGRVYIASFFYTACRTLCPDLRAQLSRVLVAFAGDTGVLVLSHSVMPEMDDPARLAVYASRNKVDGRQWKLLTGNRSEIARLARDAYFVELADTTGNTRGTLRHTETLVLVDGDGYIRGVYDGSLAYDVTQLIADVRQLTR